MYECPHVCACVCVCESWRNGKDSLILSGWLDGNWRNGNSGETGRPRLSCFKADDERLLFPGYKERHVSCRLPGTVRVRHLVSGLLILFCVCVLKQDATLLCRCACTQRRHTITVQS